MLKKIITKMKKCIFVERGCGRVKTDTEMK